MEPLYAESARPGAALIGGGAFAVACVAIAYGSMLGPGAGALVLVVGAAALAGVWAMGSYRIRLTHDELTARSVRQPVTALRAAEALDPERARAVAGPEADARALLTLRSGRPAVRVWLEAPEHPYWLISTQDPEGLAQAINSLVGAAPEAPSH